MARSLRVWPSLSPREGSVWGIPGNPSWGSKEGQWGGGGIILNGPPKNGALVVFWDISCIHETYSPQPTVCELPVGVPYANYPIVGILKTLISMNSHRLQPDWNE